MLIRTPKEIGHLVRDRRKARGWTQDALAQRLGVSRLWVVQLEQGKSTAQIGLVMRALNELDVPIQVDITPNSTATRATASGGIDLDSIIRGTSTPYRA